MSGCLSISKNNVSECIFSRPVFYTTVVTAFVLTILGGLALAGILFPSGPLSGMGAAFGNVGSSVTLGVGLAILVAAIIARLCKPEPSTPRTTQREPFL